MKIEIEDIKPICPHCEKKLDQLVEVKRGLFKINRVFCCPECHKILGLAAGGQ